MNYTQLFKIALVLLIPASGLDVAELKAASADYKVISIVRSNSRPSAVIKGGFKKLRREKWSNAKKHGMQIVSTNISGKKNIALRMELRHGDCGREKGGWDDCAHGNERVELADKNYY